MAGVINKTARPYNLKCIGKNGNRVTVRLVPGLNDVNGDHWAEFKDDEYVALLKKENKIGFGKILEESMEGEVKVKAKSTSNPTPKKKDED